MRTDITPVRGNDWVLFSCQQCGDCCRNVENAIMLEPLDAYRLARYLRQLGEVDTIEDVYSKFTHPTLLSEGFPIFLLNTQEPNDSCVFLEDNRCRIYDARLKVCRLYPFTVSFARRGKNYGYFQCLDSHRQHFCGSPVLVKDWMYQNFSKQDRDYLDSEKTILPELGKLLRELAPGVQERCLFQLLYYRYYNYDLDQPFLEQYTRNHHALMEELRHQLQTV